MGARVHPELLAWTEVPTSREQQGWLGAWEGRSAAFTQNTERAPKVAWGPLRGSHVTQATSVGSFPEGAGRGGCHWPPCPKGRRMPLAIAPEPALSSSPHKAGGLASNQFHELRENLCLPSRENVGENVIKKEERSPINSQRGSFRALCFGNKSQQKTGSEEGPQPTDWLHPGHRNQGNQRCLSRGDRLQSRDGVWASTASPSTLDSGHPRGVRTTGR